jgi:hypothetical protein
MQPEITWTRSKVSTQEGPLLIDQQLNPDANAEGMPISEPIIEFDWLPRADMVEREPAIDTMLARAQLLRLRIGRIQRTPGPEGSRTAPILLLDYPNRRTLPEGVRETAAGAVKYWKMVPYTILQQLLHLVTQSDLSLKSGALIRMELLNERYMKVGDGCVVIRPATYRHLVEALDIAYLLADCLNEAAPFFAALPDEEEEGWWRYAPASADSLDVGRYFAAPYDFMEHWARAVERGSFVEDDPGVLAVWEEIQEFNARRDPFWDPKVAIHYGEDGGIVLARDVSWAARPSTTPVAELGQQPERSGSGGDPAGLIGPDRDSGGSERWAVIRTSDGRTSGDGVPAHRHLETMVVLKPVPNTAVLKSPVPPNSGAGGTARGGVARSGGDIAVVSLLKQLLLECVARGEGAGFG